jgi:hypothetical protein
LKRELLALVIVAIAAGAIFITLLVSGELAVSCGCGPSRMSIPGCVQNPCPAQEMLAMQSYHVNSPTNVTLTLINAGSLGLHLVAYNVTESGGATYSNTSWTGLLMQPNQVATTNILIDGQSFTFQYPSAYTVTIITSRNNYFDVTITG